MKTTQYVCYGCQKTHRLSFADAYKPFLLWMMTCPKCRRYHLHKLVSLRGVRQLVESAPLWRKTA